MPLPIYQGQAKDSYLDSIKNIMLVGAGKGGVGKSTLSVEIAYNLAKQGLKVGLLDADLHGPSLGRMLSLELKPKKEENYLVPAECFGFKLMTMSFFREAALVARSPILVGTLQQFLHKVNWGELDLLIIDLPPGTGDIPLSLGQTIPLLGAMLITTPQKVALDDVSKAAELFKSINIPTLGIVENYSYFLQSDGSKVFPFGSKGAELLANKWKVPLLGEIPVDERVSKAGDSGTPFSYKYPLSEGAKQIEKVAEHIQSLMKSGDKDSLKNFYMEWKEYASK